MPRTQRSIPLFGLGTGIKRLTESKELLERRPFHRPIVEEREIAQLAVVRAALDGQTEGGFYAQEEQSTTTEEAAQRTLSPGKIILDSFPYRGDS